GRELNHDRESVRAFVGAFQKLFPPNANYRHDQLHLRTELSDEDRNMEPRNADSHLTFIGSGLASSVTYENCQGTPVFLVDLDGIYGNTRRRRQTTVIGFSRQIKKLFPKIEQHLEGGASICWGEEPWALGHNSWSRPGQGASLFAHTARPEGRVHFAGEHTAPWPLRGFMHGALESGIRAAREVNEAE
ncbi:FAD-dependent oxidoreductase, partial [Acidobacteria bacterium AH-259-O06]|nr:FAD-dependent oxidoreductase [Acidobacteria bacterium AH-259-O06]